MELKLINSGTVNKNQIIIRNEDKTVFLHFSYGTLVAVNNKVCVNSWGTTTGKLLNELEPNKKNRVSQEEVNEEAHKQLKALFK